MGKVPLLFSNPVPFPWTISQWFAPTFPVTVSMVCYNLYVPLDYHPVVSCEFPSPSHWVTFVPIPQPNVSVRMLSSQPPITAAAVVDIQFQSVRYTKYFV